MRTQECFLFGSFLTKRSKEPNWLLKQILKKRKRKKEEKEEGGEMANLLFNAAARPEGSMNCLAELVRRSAAEELLYAMKFLESKVVIIRAAFTRP